MTVAIIALFAGLAGTAWAAGLAKNSVGSKQIKPNAVKSVDVLDGAITSADVADSSITSAKIVDGSLGPADLEASLATRTFAVHRSFPADNTDVELISVPGIAVLTGRCGATNANLAYKNSGANTEVVSVVLNPATQGGGASGVQQTAPITPGGVTALGVQSTAAEGQVRVAASGQYMDADVLFAHPASDPNTCEIWTKVTVSADLGGG
jgi:hypothetical protein